MASTYDLFARAMRERKQVHCTYRGYRRVLCPVILGHTKGQQKALAFQIGGESSRPLRPPGEWRCFSLAEVTEVNLQEGPWRSGSSHQQSQTCVEEVDLDVNPESPYSPLRQL